MDGRLLFGSALALGAVLVACAADPVPDAANDEAAATAANVDDDVVAYAEQCKAELGITGPLPDLSCTDGQRNRDATSWDASRLAEVPITIGGQRVDATTYDEALSKGCDRSQWLEERCWTYDLVQRVDLGPDVDAVLNCRQKYRSSWLDVAARKAAIDAAPANAKVDAFKLAFEFNDLGYILRNKKTGKSCFFTSFGVPYYGGYIPAPDRKTMPTKAEVYAMLPEPKPPAAYDERQWNRGPKGHAELPDNMFFTPKVTADNGGCLGCHNQGAFKNSPFIDQATAPSIGRIVPANDRTKPYLLVGHAFQKSFKKNAVMEIDTGAGNENTCVACHRMSRSEGGSFAIAQWAVGQDPPAMSDWAAAWPQRAWMRPNHGKPSEAAYRAELGSDIDQLFCCMQTPDAKGCLKRPLGPTVADVRLDANGDLDPAGWVSASSSATASCVP